MFATIQYQGKYYPWSIDVKTKEVARKIKGETVHITTGELFNNPAIITHISATITRDPLCIKFALM
jgi:hypothetical protein